MRKWRKKIAMLESQVRATDESHDCHANGEEENKYAKKIAMLESQVRATDTT